MKPWLFFFAFLVLCLLFIHDSAPAQDTGSIPEWSVATSLTYPFAGICQVHISYNPGGNHEDINSPVFAPQLIIGLKM
jgi:hypothetical protein